MPSDSTHFVIGVAVPLGNIFIPWNRKYIEDHMKRMPRTIFQRIKNKQIIKEAVAVDSTPVTRNTIPSKVSTHVTYTKSLVKIAYIKLLSGEWLSFSNDSNHGNLTLITVTLYKSHARPQR